LNRLFWRRAGSSWQIIEQRLCRFEIGGTEAFGEPIVHRRQEFGRLVTPRLVAPQSGKAGGAAQFPGARTLTVRPVDCLPEETLGRCGRSGSALQQNKLAFDPQQLSNCPAFFAPLGADDRLLYRGEPICDLPGSAQSLCHKERKEARDGPSRRRFVEGSAQQL